MLCLKSSSYWYCSDVLKDIQISLPTIPLKHQPQIIKINQLYKLIKEGLFK